MPLLNEITPQSWMDDIQFVLGTFLRSESENVKAGYVQDYLSKRYEARWVPIVSESLRASYNWITKNWAFLAEVGLRKPNGGIVNCVLFTLYNEIFRDPDLVRWKTIPSIDPRVIVHEAQKFIDADSTSQQGER